MKLILLLILLFPVGSAAKQQAIPSVKHKVNLSWKLPARYNGFVIYRAISNGPYVQLIAVGKTTVYTDNDVKANTTYHYKAKTYCNLCTPTVSTNFSNIVTITVP